VVDLWVRRQLDGPEEWMLRQSAVDAITARGHREDARGSLDDPYPRVRSRAATALSGDPDTLVQRATLARRDTWPLVRAEAVTSLRTEGQALPVIVASVDDSMSVVRVAAIEVLAAASHDEGWERVHRRLRARNEWPRVTAAAIGYVVAHCRTDAVGALLRIVMRAAPSNALTDDLNNSARAIEALRALGSPEAKAAVEQLGNTDGVPPTLQMALEQPPPKDGGCASSGR
jgi:HEAT repeat protein